MVDELKVKASELSKLIIDNENGIDWTIVLESFDFYEILENNDRLVRSQSFGDEDYDYNVFLVIYQALKKNKNDAYAMVEYIFMNYTNISQEDIHKYLDNNLPFMDYDDNYDFNLYIGDINKSIKEGEYVKALDRLHTFMHKYLKELCNNHNIEYNDKDRVDELFKKYAKFLKPNVSKMTNNILGSFAFLWGSFNEVRNNNSLAHGKNILNNLESELIVKTFINIKDFIDDIEEKMANDDF